MDCPLCKSLLQTNMDDYFYKCDCCEAIVKDKAYYLSAEEEKSRYEEHNNDVNDFGYQKFTAPVTNAILEKYEPHHTGLDYGCGTGPVITEMLRQNGYQVRLYDPFFHPDMDYLNHRYDYIFSCEVFEHFHNPNDEIVKIVNLLKPGGRLLIMTHIYDPSIPFKHWYYRNDATHVFIYQKPTFLYIARVFKLEIESLNNRMAVYRKPF